MIFKKKFGFTLAEILITLGIIGVVAAMTIPTLMKNTQDIELKSAWKKAYSVFSQAAINVKNDNGGTFLNLTNLRDSFGTYIKYSRTCEYNGTDQSDVYGNCFHPLTGSYFDTVKTLNGTSHLQVNNYYPYMSWGTTGAVLSDGQLAVFAYTSGTCTDTTRVEGYTNACGWITIDVNGFRGPNTIGRDIFSIDILNDKITPTGTGNLSNTCNASSDGRGCAAQYLYQ